MLEALKPLLDSGVLNEETRSAINEAWEAKLNEAREAIRAEVREEFAGRYEHDKSVMVEALDKMVTETLQDEIAEFQADKKAIAEHRVRVVNEMKQKSSRFEQFLTNKLAEEITEFRRDRKQMQEAVAKLENFVFQALAEEITEFAQDKRAVVETKVRLVAEAKNQLNDLKKKFVSRSSRAVEEAVTKHLKAEMSQLREDITEAKQNNFGRKIFEAFASEFSNTQLNESAELRKLYGIIKQKDVKLAKAEQIVADKQSVLESKMKEIRALNERRERETVLNELLAPLNREKKTVMKELLESVKTANLRTAFDKYLPAVLNEDHKVTSKKTVITEGKTEVTGNKTAKNNEDKNNIIDIKRLAGLNS
jgi:predicted DNA-binding protein